MIIKQHTLKLLLLSFTLLLISGCGLIVGLIFKDYRSKVAYRSSPSKKNYYIIEGVTQSHCGCSDIVVRNYKNKEIDFTFFYGGGLFPAKKFVYQRNPGSKNVDTLIYIPTTNEAFTISFDSLDKEILKHIDTLITLQPRGSGLVYQVKRHVYKGFIKQK